MDQNFNCTFSGDLKPGSHHIDGKEIVKGSPKLIIKNCMLSDTEKMNSKSINLLSDGMKSQVFIDEKSSHDIRKESVKKSWKIVIVETVTVLLVSFAIIYVIKKSQNNIEEESEDIGMQNDTFVP